MNLPLDVLESEVTAKESYPADRGRHWKPGEKSPPETWTRDRVQRMHASHHDFLAGDKVPHAEEHLT